MKFNKKVYQAGLIFLFLFLPASFLYYGNPLDHLPGTDNGVFLYGGQQILAGHTPYLDFWDHKGPLIYFINALGLLFGKGSRWGVWTMELFFLALTAAGIYQIARNQWGKTAGIIAIVYWSYTLGQVGHYKYFNDSNYTEAYSLLFNVAAVYFWTWSSRSNKNHWGWFAIGIATGFSLLLRPNNIGIQVSIVLADFVAAAVRREYKDIFKKASFLALGLSTVLAVFIVWCLSHGAFSKFWDAVFIYNAYYAQKNQVKGFANSYVAMVVGSFNKLGWFPFVGYGILLFLWVYRQARKKFFDVQQENILILMLLIGLPLETILSSISGRVFYHYVIVWTPYLGLLAGDLAKEVLVKIPSRHALHKLVPATILTATLACLLATNIPVVKGYARLGNYFLFRNNKPLEAQNAIVQYIDDVTNPGDTVLVWGNYVWINFLSDRISPTKYSYQFPLFMPGYATESLVLDFLNTLQASPPVLIIEPKTDTAEMLPLNPALRAAATYAQVGIPKGMPLVFEYVNENYCIIREFHGTLIYRLKKYSGCK
jgi:4-amino-4-deoxy-L-arabinose transferase-like glycosyltransferase